MFSINVSLFAHFGKHYCGNKLCFSGSKNVPPRNSKTFLLRKNQMFQMSPARKHCFRHVKTMFKDYSANINNTLRFVRANVSQEMFPSLPILGNMTKYRTETMFPQQCFLVCPELNSLWSYSDKMSRKFFTFKADVNKMSAWKNVKP